jgi:hypothetical protein
MGADRGQNKDGAGSGLRGTGSRTAPRTAGGAGGIRLAGSALPGARRRGPGKERRDAPFGPASVPCPYGDGPALRHFAGRVPGFLEDRACSADGRPKMKVGMMWLDSERDAGFDERLARAAAYYSSKYGRQANLAVVHPETIGEPAASGVQGLTVRLRSDILRDHFWIGVDEAAESDARERGRRPDSPGRR